MRDKIKKLLITREETDITNIICGYPKMYAFAYASNLKQAYISVPIVYGGDGIIPDGLFRSCYNLEKVNYNHEEDITRIGDYAFGYCSLLTSIPNQSGLTNIGKHAFQHCELLTSAFLQNTSYIDDYAFTNCSILYSVIAPKASYIGINAFLNCPIYTISLPSIMTLQSGAFSGCSALVNCYVGTSSSTEICSLVSSTAFANCVNLKYIYVAPALVETYRSAPYWSVYASLITSM